jgi:transcriptional regulator with XRE-family HTH domain
MQNDVRRLRKSRGLTQKELAARSGVAKPIVSRLDANPSARVPLDVAIRLAQTLAVRPEDLLLKTA